jgi:hypothetical protein
VESTTTGQSYEFTTHENEVISKTERWIRWFAWIAIGGGILMGLGGALNLPTGVTNMLLGIVYVMVGMACRRAADAFASVVSTTGNDVAHLMSALANLGSVFKTMVIMIGLTLVTILIVGTYLAMGLADGSIPTS